VRGGILSLKQPFSFYLLLFNNYSLLDLLIHLFVVLFGTVSVLVLLILPQDPNNRSSASQTIEDGVCASPRIATSYNSLVGKVHEGSVQCIVQSETVIGVCVCVCVCMCVYVCVCGVCVCVYSAKCRGSWIMKDLILSVYTV